MGELMVKDGKIMHYTTAKNIRALVKKANALRLLKEDIIKIAPMKDYFYMVYYYEGVELEEEGV